MTLNEFLDEFDNLSEKRIVEGQKKFLRDLLNNPGFDHIKYSLQDFMGELRDLEQDDFFGTEGMDI